MDRRLTGVVVLVLALIAVTVVPSLDGRRMAGTAVASTFPDPPQVGECLLPPFPDSVDHAGALPEIPVTAVRFGSCDGMLAGEVIAVWPTGVAATSAGIAGSVGRGPCYRQAAAYAGLQTFGPSTDAFGGPSDGSVIWKPTIGFDPYQVVPGVREAKAGRSWMACLAVPTGHPGYRGTLRSAFTDGHLPDEFGLCWAGVDLDRIPARIGCDRPHPAELLATGFVRDRVRAPTEVIDGSCADIAGRIMRTEDPTRGGTLNVVADRFTGDAPSRDDAPLSIGCFVTTAGAQQLSGTIIGLGDRPVPFAQ